LGGEGMMDVLDNYKIQVSFDTVRSMIEQKQFPLNENGKANLKRSISFLHGVTQSIDSLDVSKNEEKAYHFTPKLRDIIGIKNNKTKISKDDLNESKKYFDEIKSHLEIMMTNPQEIYSSQKNADKLKNVISQIMDVYAESTYVVEKDFTLSGTVKFSDL
jgi:hypothetical protein